MSGQLWAVDSLGGHLVSLNLSDTLRMAVDPMTKFRQFADVKDATMQGKRKGDTFHWDVIQRRATRAQATLSETNTMPETNFTIVQGTLTINEAGNSVPYTGKLDNLSKFPIENIIKKVMKPDAAEWFDASVFTQFNATPLRVVASSGTDTALIQLTTDGTAVATNSVSFRKTHVKSIVDTMRERNIPAYTGDDYIALGWPTTFRPMKDQIEDMHQYTETGLKMIFNGEVGRYEKVRFVEQTNVPKGGPADSTTFNAFTNTADPWEHGLSDWIFFFGDDTVAEAICVPEEIRGKIPTDYGRSKGIAWYFLGGHGIVHPEDSTTNSRNARILKWDSAS